MRNTQNSGFALVLALVTMVVLFIVVAEYRWSTNLEIARSNNCREITNNYDIAKAGLNYMIEVLQKSKQHFGATDSWYEFYPGEKSSTEKFFVDKDSQFFYQISCQDEDGKVNLNFLDEDLVNLFRLFDFESQDCKIFKDSLLDWIDSNNDHRINGKEQDYYKRLRPFYHCKNAPLDSLNELFLIHGFREHNRKQFFGKNTQGFDLRKIATVYTSEQKVNINTSPAIVLQTYLQLQPEQIQKILQLRQEKKVIQNISEVTSFLGQESTKIKTSSQTFRITVRSGHIRSTFLFFLEAILRIDTSGKVKFLYYSEM